MRHKENIKNAQHSKVGRVNLGARIAPKASRKCQDAFYKMNFGVGQLAVRLTQEIKKY